MNFLCNVFIQITLSAGEESAKYIMQIGMEEIVVLSKVFLSHSNFQANIYNYFHLVSFTDDLKFFRIF